MNGDLVAPAVFKTVVPNRKVREVGSIPTRPRTHVQKSISEVDVQKLMRRSC